MFSYRNTIATCARGKRRVVILGRESIPDFRVDCSPDENACGWVSHITLAGDVVAYAETHQAGDTQIVFVRNALSGRILHRVRLQVSHGCNTQSAGIEKPPLIFVKPNGTVAWLQDDYYVTHGGNPPPPCAAESVNIYAIETDGFHRIAALGSSPPERIELRGSTLSWTVQNQTYSAILH